MINVTIPSIEPELKPRITVFGVGGAGGNAVNNMIKSNLEGVDFVVGNTDAQALKGSMCEKRIQLGTTVTRGLGAGSKPDVGRASAEEQIDEIVGHLEGSNMVFITAGMGGGTGTGAAPVIARAARERGILTVGVVTKPFHFEGAHRMRLAESGIAELQQYVDTLIIIPNQNLFRIANEKTTFADAFKMADDVLHSGVRGVTDLMVMPGLINLDFADIRSVMTEMGKAMMGTGEAGGERRAIEAAEAAISNPLLDDVSMKGARGVLINITGGYDMTLFEVDEAANRVRDEVDPDANIIFGSTFDSTLDGVMRVSVVATGIDAAAMANPRGLHPVNLSLVSDRNGGKKPGGPAGLTQAAPTGLTQAAPNGLTQAAPVSPAIPGVPAGGLPPRAMGNAAPQMSAQPQHVAHHAEAPAPMAMHPVDPAVQHHAPVHHQDVGAHAVETAPMRTAATGPLHSERRDGHFIAPKPADPGPRQPMNAPAMPQSMPMSSQLASAPAQEPAPARKPNFLFGLVTGLAGRKAEAPAPQPQPAPQPMMQPVHHQQPVHQQAPQQAPMPPAAPQAMAPAPRQQTLGMDGNPQQKIDEEALDIPAFLRRQAN
ncbi:cell division protein FtsZ [Azospirillum rugosum]|uniref:Cell division protein FtsZ n=1 Tax=Azospirillum rugosum TaxID=416170 RepID=A0ABS4SS09_9PROT|nr:cell division protein FtsZ [Azospirillum rugosum]MBP2295344.1 cell division protein FtsZ [Azospirillum rugosum]MDQ0528719.1 cell division protein FtsZ [Azospirillum rugosum]